MQALQGIVVSPGVAIGEALVIDHEGFRIPRRTIPRAAVDAELGRLNQAIESVARDIEQHREAVTAQLGAQYGAIFSAHLQMLRDPQLYGELEQGIRRQHLTPEYAVSRTLRRYAAVLQQLDNQYLGERAHDVWDIERRLLRCLLGGRREGLAELTAPVVVLAHTLTPGQLASVDRRYVLGVVTETGGPGSHTAIIAKGMEIPAVVGAGRFLADVSGGDVVIIDGDQGQVVVRPDESTIARYRQQKQQRRSAAQRLDVLRDLPAESADGVRVELHANLEFPHEVHSCLERGADGIGLYRTEFLYLGADGQPTDEIHFQAYAQVLRAMGDRPVVIRTLDLGADKMSQPLMEAENNPFLGLRSIRLSLRNQPAFRTQLRALLRASTLGRVRVMFPMISTLAELRQAKRVLAEAMNELEAEGVAFDRHLPVGMMVEVPGTVLILDKFLREVDFISIGTNDLIQYALAVDRGNRDVADLYHATDPAVLRLIDLTLDAARRAGVPASICGQMSAEPAHALLLLGLGLRSFSVPASSIPELKRIVRSVTVAQCEQIARQALEMDSAEQIDAFLAERFRNVVLEPASNG